MHRSVRLLPLLFAAALPLTLVAQDRARPAGKDAKTPPKVAVPAPPAPGALKPFDEVVKEAKQAKGLFPLWTKDDKVYLEIAPEQLGQLYFFSMSSTQGVGERGLYGGMMEGSHGVYFKRIGNTLQLLARNLEFTAKAGTPMARGVQEGFSDSLLASAPVLSLPKPEGKTFLVEANALFINDLPMGATMLELAYRQPYQFDRNNSSFVKTRATEDMDTFMLSAHYNLAKLMLPPLTMPGAPAPMFMPLPSTLEDVRSLFMGYHFSLAKLPADPMAPRYGDDRVGYFATTRWDFSHDLKGDPRERLIHRWRLEKKDPAAALSEPKAPIVYWLDRNMPLKYRDTVTAGILEWNKAFARIGYKDAVQVKVQPEDADWDTQDARHASVRWLVGTDIGFAIGPSQVDPRTGEILDADIGVGDIWTRNPRRVFLEELPAGLQRRNQQCLAAAEASEELAFATDLLAARGDLAPDSPEAEAYVLATLKDVVTHEVGHTLGLRHNFRASTIYTLAQLSDPAFTREHGLTGSVMDYNALNLATKGEKQGEYVMSTLGPYDYWAIEYGYQTLPAAEEKGALLKIANRSHTDPALAYGTDEDAMGFGGLEGMDPEVNRRDLGSDPLAFFRKRIDLSRELWDRIQNRTLKDGEDYSALYRSFRSGLGQYYLVANLTAKYVGGVVNRRDHAGSAHLPLEPVPAARQREALKLLETGIFSVDAFRFKPDFMAKLVPERHDFLINPDFSLSQYVLGIQRATLAQLFRPNVAARILDADLKVTDTKHLFHLSELFDGVQNAVWSELRTGKEAGSMRRSLQKEHLRNLAGLVLRANGATPEDARALAREGLKALQGQLKKATLKPGATKEAKAHFSECLATIDETLRPSVQRMSM